MIKVGNAPCSWGTIEFMEDQYGRIDYEQMLDELAATGYAGTELGDWGYLPTDPDGLRNELETRKLTMLGAFVPVSFKNHEAHANGEIRAVRTARLLGAVSDVGDANHRPFIVLADEGGDDTVRTRNAGRIMPAMGLSDAEWQVFVDGVERVARAVREETGLPTVYHHHCGGYIETSAETMRLLDMTDPDLVGLVFDTGHYAYGAGGCDNLITALDRFADRVEYLHFKDYDPVVGRRAREEAWDYFEAVKQGVFCELGQGCVDFPSVVDWLHNHEYDGWITVEQDVFPGLGAPKESAQRNRDYLRNIGLS